VEVLGCDGAFDRCSRDTFGDCAVMSEIDNTMISLRPCLIVYGSSICRACHLSLLVSRHFQGNSAREIWHAGSRIGLESQVLRQTLKSGFLYQICKLISLSHPQLPITLLTTLTPQTPCQMPNQPKAHPPPVHAPIPTLQPP
jgi:hypothetical protein